MCSIVDLAPLIFKCIRELPLHVLRYELFSELKYTACHQVYFITFRFISSDRISSCEFHRTHLALRAKAMPRETRNLNLHTHLL